MNVAILDASFPIKNQSGRGMSTLYLKWEMDKRNIKEYLPDSADMILVSCQSTESTPFVKQLRSKYPQKIIICGGAASTSPYTLGLYCDMVCVGDGQKFLDVLFREGIDKAKLLSNVWIHGETRLVDIDNGFPWDMPPIQGEDGAFRIWCGRGCKKKCAFCQTGWAYEYNENPNPERAILSANKIITNGGKIAYLSNDLMQHSFYSRLPHTNHGSYSVEYLAKAGSLPPATQIRLGVEGVSERLRRSVSKPISSNDLIGCTVWLNKNKKSVRWFMIAGLPGETKDDWEELKDVVLRWKSITSKGVLALSFTAFSPDPATPLSIEPITDDYWDYFLDFKEWFFGGKGWSNRIKLMNPQQPKTRMQKAIFSMGLSEQQLRRGGYFSPNWERLSYPYKQKVEQKMRKRSVELLTYQT